MIWFALGLAVGLALGYLLSRRQHRRHLEEVEERYTRITGQDRKRGGTAVPPGTGISRVATGKYKHKRGSVHG